MNLLGASVGFAVALALVVLGCSLWRATTALRHGIQVALVAAESLNGLTRQLDLAQLAKALAEASRERHGAAVIQRGWHDSSVGRDRKPS
jgi:hypothetical protein